MEKGVTVFFLFISVFGALAQDKPAADPPRVFAEIAPKREGMKDFFATGLGDSLLFSYEFQGQGSIPVLKSLTADGQATDIFFSNNLLASARWGSKIYYYWLSGSRKSLFLNARVGVVGDKSSKNANDSIPIDGDLVGTFVKKNLHVISYNEKTEEITILEVMEMEVARTRKFKLPFPLRKWVSNQNPIMFIQDESIINSFNGSARTKLYRYGDDYFLTLDLPSEYKNRTELLLLRDQVEWLTFPETSTKNFSSYYFDGKLFRLKLAGKYAELVIYDVATRKGIDSLEILKEGSDFKIYTRDGKANTILHEEKFKDVLIYFYSIPSVVVYKDSGKYILQCGHYLSEKRVGGFGGSNLLAQAAGIVIETTVRYMGEEKGTSRYFYIQYDPGSNVKSVNTDGTNLLREKIDRYEIESLNEKTGAKIGFKGYLDHKEGVVGVYYDKKLNKVRFVLFK